MATAMFMYMFALFLSTYASPVNKRCPYNQYRVIGQDNCMECPHCGIGSGMNKPCQSIIPYNPKDAPHCVSCVNGVSFSNFPSSEECIPCSNRCSKEEHEVETKRCIRYQDRFCRCKTGYFLSEIDGKCEECCYCGLGGSHRSIKKCIDDKMSNGKYCAPTRADRKCDARNITTSRPPTLETKGATLTVVPTSSPKTTVRVERNITITMSPPEVTSQSNEIIIIVVVIVVLILLIIVVIICHCKPSARNSPKGNVRKMFLLREEGSLPSSQTASTSSLPSWRLISTSSLISSNNVTLDMSEIPCKSAPLAPQGSPIQPSSDNYAAVGPFLASIGQIQKLELAGMLDKRESGNWWDIGECIARGNSTLLDAVRKCHQCYYGGGSPCLEMFTNLSTSKLELTVMEFVTIAKELKRQDIVSYIQKNGLTNKIFIDIEHHHKVKIADILDRRVENTHGWDSFADKLGFSTDDINKFRLKIKEPKNHSPTIELINVLVQNRPELTIENIQEAANIIGRHDVRLFLDKVMADNKCER